MQRNNHGVIGNIARQPGSFAVAFLVMFFVTYGFLALTGATPDPVVAENTNGSVDESPVTTPASVKELPVRIVVKKIGVDATVANPQSTNLTVLDNALHDGAARYPTSALLGEQGTTVIFGHSSYLPVVHNQTYKTFSGIQTLKKGETISVYSGTREYRYAVTSVRVANAEEDVVELAQRGKQLVLITCDSFSKKSSRFVVTADFVGTYSLASN